MNTRMISSLIIPAKNFMKNRDVKNFYLNKDLQRFLVNPFYSFETKNRLRDQFKTIFFLCLGILNLLLISLSIILQESNVFLSNNLIIVSLINTLAILFL